MRPLRIAIAAALVGAALASPATAKGSSPRVERLPYEVGSELGASSLGPVVGSVTFPEGPERFVELEVTDTGGGAVLAEIVQDDRIDRFCTSTNEAIPITPGFAVEIQLVAGRCLDGSPSVVTQGEIEARFYMKNPSPKESATLEREYSITAPGSFIGVDAPLPGNVIISNITFPGGPKEFVSLEIEDATGGAVASVVSQGGVEIARFCGKTPEPVAVGKWNPFTVDLHVGVCTDGAQSAPTNGVVTAAFVKGK
jgi:hypothetical protein